MSEHKMRNKGPKSCQYYIEQTIWAIEMIMAIKWSKCFNNKKITFEAWFTESLRSWWTDLPLFLRNNPEGKENEVNQICKPKLFCKSCSSWETIKIIETRFILHCLTPERKNTVTCCNSCSLFGNDFQIPLPIKKQDRRTKIVKSVWQ